MRKRRQKNEFIKANMAREKKHLQNRKRNTEWCNCEFSRTVCWLLFVFSLHLSQKGKKCQNDRLESGECHQQKPQTKLQDSTECMNVWINEWMNVNEWMWMNEELNYQWMNWFINRLQWPSDVYGGMIITL